MLTVMELLTFPLFRNFRLVSGYGGLYNRITGTGIFEWESSYEVERNFEQGEFVITTLSLSKNDPGLAEASIRMLIDKKVSAIAIKDIYFRQISEELKSYSDDCRVPVFFFSETFFDDIIYTIKHTLLTQSRDFSHDEEIDDLLDNRRSPEQIRKKALEINPFFHSRIQCCYGLPKKGHSWQKERKPFRPDPEEIVYSVLEYRRGLLVIYTERTPSAQEDRFLSFLENSGLRQCLTNIGLGSAVKGLENLGASIQESWFASISSQIDQTEIRRFRDAGLDQILLPSKDAPWMRNYYERLLAVIEGYDARHGVSLMETLTEYVSCGGDFKMTAEKLYQHSNTVRYRIDKIRNLLSLGSEVDSFSQLSILVRLDKIYRHDNLG